MRKKIILFTISFFLVYILIQLIKRVNWNPKHEIGEVLDEYNGVKVYYNGGVSNTEGRNITQDGQINTKKNLLHYHMYQAFYGLSVHNSTF